MVRFVWRVVAERLFSLPLTKVGIHYGHVGVCATPYPISWMVFVLDLGPSCADKLLEFRWVRVARLSWLVCFCAAAEGGGISWVLLAVVVGLMLSGLLVPLLGASMAFWALAALVLKVWSVGFVHLGCG